MTIKNLSDEEIVVGFLDHVRYFQVAHHIPGRIRIKAGWDGVKELAQANVSEREIDEIIQRIPGIIDYRANKKALTVIIHYDKKVIPFQLWENIGTLKQDPARYDKLKASLLNLLQLNN